MKASQFAKDNDHNADPGRPHILLISAECLGQGHFGSCIRRCLLDVVVNLLRGLVIIISVIDLVDAPDCLLALTTQDMVLRTVIRQEEHKPE